MTRLGGVFACPSDGASTSFQIFAGIDRFNRTDCIAVMGLLSVVVSSSEFGAWQYI